jgi:hypothetical protein
MESVRRMMVLTGVSQRVLRYEIGMVSGVSMTRHSIPASENLQDLRAENKTGP